MFGLSYWFLPLFSGCVWLGTLLAMLGRWAAIGKPHYSYEPASEHIPLISDIAATSWGYPLFIAGSATSVAVFNLSFIAERWLRHRRRLTPNYDRIEIGLSICAIIAACVGALGLIFLTIFDIVKYDHVHDAMLCVFIAGYIVSAIFICAEYQRLGVHYRQERILAASFWVKLAFIIIEIALVVAFGVTELHDQYYASAPLEWVISLVFIFYQFSFIMDFLPATHTKAKENRYLPPARHADDEMAMNTEAHGNMLGGPVYTAPGMGLNGSAAASSNAQHNVSSTGSEYQSRGPISASQNF